MLSDEHVRLQAINPNDSFIIQAPAGSGKTSLLVDRFVTLLKFCKDPEECLAITFTKKAAFEMRHRVLQKLEQITKHSGHDLKLDHIYHQSLANPNKLQILTIDAFCASLTQKLPILSKFGIDLKIEEYPEKLYQEAVERFLSTINNSNNNDNIIKLFRYFANDHELIKKLFIDMLFKREQWLPLIVPMKVVNDISKVTGKHFDLQQTLEHNLKQAIEDILAEIIKFLPEKAQQNEIIYLAKHAANNISDMQNNIFYCKNLTNDSHEWPAANSLHLSVWRGLADLLLNKDGDVRSMVSVKQGFLAVSNIKDPEQKKIANQLKTRMHYLLKHLKEHDQIFLSKLQQIMVLPDLQYNTENWEMLDSLFCLLPELVAHLMLVFEEYQAVDFTQIAIAALDAMGTDTDPTNLALFLDHKLNHILIDEFQDTSILQFNLIKKLVTNWGGSDGRTVFVVGDPMQSIYRFRQANVGLFLKAKEHGIGDVQLKNLYLTTNFRSSNSIICHLNKIFYKIFPSENDIIYGGVAYSSVEAANDGSKDIINNIDDVEFFLTEDANAEAENVVQLITYLRAHNAKVSIAILVRVKSHASFIIKKLRDYDVPYQANDMEPLANQPVICDLISLTRAILHLHDTIAWLSVLRGPLVGLKLKDLHLLFTVTKFHSLLNGLYNYKDNKELSQDAISRLDYVLPILLAAVEQREILNLSILIKKTWLNLGGNLLLSSVDLDLAENFFHKLLKITNIFEINGIEKLINKYFVQSHVSKINLTSVQIMTIHKAKGLEFDVVIVPGMDKSPKISDNPLFLWEERTGILSDYLLFAPIKSAIQIKNSIYNFIKRSEGLRELHEAKRLLYVAMTRAKNKFYGFAVHATKSNKSFLRFLESDVIFNKTHNEPVDHVRATINNKKSIILNRIPIKWYTKE